MTVIVHAVYCSDQILYLLDHDSIAFQLVQRDCNIQQVLPRASSLLKIQNLFQTVKCFPAFEVDLRRQALLLSQSSQDIALAHLYTAPLASTFEFP
jgi:hypothetical protein